MELVRKFLSGVIEASGGVVEASPDGLAVLLPADGAACLGLPEEGRIAFDASAEGEAGLIDGRLGSRLVERLVQRQLERPAATALALAPELPRALPEHLPVLLNAVRRGPADRSRLAARYLVVRMRLALQADELRSVLESVCLRLADGARVSLLRLDGEYRSASPVDASEAGKIGRALEHWLHREGPARLSGALETLRRRARRDLERMAEYYASLDAEMAKATRRARSEDERARRRGKRATLAGDLEARRAQLRERLRARLTAAPVGATLVETDVERFTVPVRRRALEGKVEVLCRAADGSFEGPACAACAVATLRFYLCDERMHVLCEACGQSGRLDRPRCPACTARRAPAPVLEIEDPTRRLTLGAG
jgi:hypothetical protein